MASDKKRVQVRERERVRVLLGLRVQIWVRVQEAGPQPWQRRTAFGGRGRRLYRVIGLGLGPGSFLAQGLWGLAWNLPLLGQSN